LYQKAAEVEIWRRSFQSSKHFFLYNHFTHFLKFKTMKKYLFIFSFFGFVMAHCGKTMVNPDHVNKFTCKVNGVFWEAIPHDNFILGNDLQMTKAPFFDVGYIYASNVKKNQTINLDFSLSDTAKTSPIRNSNPFGDYKGNCNVYNLDTLYKRTVTITEHDKIKKIVKGTFSFRAINSSVGCVDTATVTEGFFDMQYLIQ
jgi:hypothetical protein